MNAPWHVGEELLEILSESNDNKPERGGSESPPQEITPVSREAFKKIFMSVSAVLNLRCSSRD